MKQRIKPEGVFVKSRRGVLIFGSGLPDEEVRYLCSLVRAALAGRKLR